MIFYVMAERKITIMETMKAIRIAMLLAVVMMLTGCGHKAVEDIRYKVKKAELGTVQYTVRQIIRNSDETWQLFGDKKVLFTVKATLKAGIDLQKVTDDDIEVNGSSIVLHLPKAEITAINIEPKDIQVAYSKVSILRSDYTQAQCDEILQAGELSIRTDQALRQSIVAEAEQNARDFFELLLRSNGFEDIKIFFK